MPAGAGCGKAWASMTSNAAPPERGEPDIRPRRASHTSCPRMVEAVAGRAGHQCANAEAFCRGILPDARHDARIADGSQGFLGEDGVRQCTQDVTEHGGLLLHQPRGRSRQSEARKPRLSRHQRDIVRHRMAPRAFFRRGGDPDADGPERQGLTFDPAIQTEHMDAVARAHRCRADLTRSHRDHDGLELGSGLGAHDLSQRGRVRWLVRDSWGPGRVAIAGEAG